MIHRGALRQYGAVKDILVRRDSTTMTFQDLPDDARAEIEKIVRERGGQITQTEETLETLEDVFLKTVREEKTDDKEEKA
jgi:hypothetical protein